MRPRTNPSNALPASVSGIAPIPASARITMSLPSPGLRYYDGPRGAVSPLSIAGLNVLAWAVVFAWLLG